MNIPYEMLQTITADQPYPLLFATISGAHLYGFPSPDSDYDLRGVHILPPAQVMGLYPVEDTREISAVQESIELDLVTHDIKKFFELILKPNGYVLEQLYSPLIVYTTPEHAELKVIARSCLTPHHAHHYLGFARSQWGLFLKETPHRVKPLLYVFRVLLTGIHLLKTGEVEANLVNLQQSYPLPYIPELIERKVTGTEQGTLEDHNLEFYQREYERLLGDLELARIQSSLPQEVTGKPALNDLLLRCRMTLL